MRWVTGQSDRFRSKPEKSYTVAPPLQSLPSGMNPAVRPAPSERSIANQLYKEFGPLCATAAAHAGFFGWIAPVALRPSFQHR